MKIAMWSGPRNLSTAMMYSFGARADFAIWDEPFYAPYLAATGIEHPMRDEIIKTHESDAARVATACAGPIPDGKEHFYMKHMPLHMVDGFPLDWARDCVNVHLIRHPARVIASYSAKREDPTLEDIGFLQQLHVFQALGGVVVDSSDIRAAPEAMLRLLCETIDMDWDPAMLHWAPGGRREDGIWARHWYGAIHRSTGFAGPEGALPQVDSPLLAGALPAFETLSAQKLRL